MIHCLIQCRRWHVSKPSCSSNAHKLVLSCGSIFKYANLGYELGQSDVELSQSDVNPNLGGAPSGMNEPSVKPPPDKSPVPPDETLDEPPGINWMFCFDTYYS